MDATTLIISVYSMLDHARATVLTFISFALKDVVHLIDSIVDHLQSVLCLDQEITKTCEDN